MGEINMQFNLGMHCDRCDLLAHANVQVHRGEVVIDITGYNLIQEPDTSKKTSITFSLSQWKEFLQLTPYIDSAVKESIKETGQDNDRNQKKKPNDSIHKSETVHRHRLRTRHHH
jgi:hypothetical protein